MCNTAGQLPYCLQFLRIAQLLLERAQVCDVTSCAYQTYGFAVWCENDFGFLLDEPFAVVRSQNAVLNCIGLALGSGLTGSTKHNCLILWVNSFQEERQRHNWSLGVIAKNSISLRRPPKFPADKIVVPAADMGNTLCSFQILFASSQTCFSSATPAIVDQQQRDGSALEGKESSEEPNGKFVLLVKRRRSVHNHASQWQSRQRDAPALELCIVELNTIHAFADNG